MVNKINETTEKQRTILKGIKEEQTLENKRYAIWNNKGGVGKTALTFMLATEYAHQYPKREVVVIDACPQANISEVLLGGNERGSRRLGELIQARNTLGGYFINRIENTPYGRTGNESSYAIQASDNNDYFPQNLHLVVGDPILERLVDSMTGLARLDLPENAWRQVHSWILDLTEGISINKGGRAVFFIDCNPSFAIYTKQALIATKRLIVPCTADNSSARGIENVASLVYGINNNFDMFHTRIRNNGIDVPLIHLVPFNQSTQYDSDAASAFAGMYQNVQTTVETLKNNHMSIFSENGLENTFFDVRDMHSTFRVAVHEGCPLHMLRATNYDIHGKTVQINSRHLSGYRECIRDLITRF